VSGFSPIQLKGWRLRKGWTLDVLASEMSRSNHKISKAALGQFEKGTSKPRASTLRALADVFEIRPNDLLERDFSLKFLGFRSLASLSKTHRERIKSVMTWRAENREKLCSLSGHERKDWSGGRHRVDVVEQADECSPYVKPENLDRDFRLAARCVTEGALSVEEAAKMAGVRRGCLSDQIGFPRAI